jgi:hypothetical protein
MWRHRSLARSHLPVCPFSFKTACEKLLNFGAKDLQSMPGADFSSLPISAFRNTLEMIFFFRAQRTKTCRISTLLVNEMYDVRKNLLAHYLYCKETLHCIVQKKDKN